MGGGTWPPFHGEPEPGRKTKFLLDGTDDLIDAPPANKSDLNRNSINYSIVPEHPSTAVVPPAPSPQGRGFWNYCAPDDWRPRWSGGLMQWVAGSHGRNNTDRGYPLIEGFSLRETADRGSTRTALKPHTSQKNVKCAIPGSRFDSPQVAVG